MNLDLTRLGRLAPPYLDLQDPFAVLRFVLVRVHIVPEADRAPEFAAETLLAVVGRLVVDRYISLARHGEQPPLHGDIQLLRIDPRSEQVNLYLRRGLNHVRLEEHTSELQSPMYLVCRLLLAK